MITYEPMLASPLDKGVVHDWTEWCAEEKFDGHRLLIHVQSSAPGLRVGRVVTAYTRPRKRAGGSGAKEMATRSLPRHLEADLLQLPAGVYDGELVGGDVSTDVTRLDLKANLRYVMFDIIEQRGQSMCSHPYFARRALLEEVRRLQLTHVSIADSTALKSQAHLERIVKGIWDRGGEGVIIKHRNELYHSNRRSKLWLKIKRRESAAGKVTGFEETRGEVMNRGQFAIIRGVTDAGIAFTCKTPTDEALAELEQEWRDMLTRYPKRQLDPQRDHPAIGRRLLVDHFGQTRDKGLRGPVIFDRWEAD